MLFIGGTLNSKDIAVDHDRTIIWEPVVVDLDGESRQLFEQYKRQTLEFGDGRVEDVFYLSDLPAIEVLGRYSQLKGMRLSEV